MMALLKPCMICRQRVIVKSSLTETFRRYISQPVKPRKAKAEGFTVSILKLLLHEFNKKIQIQYE